MNLVSLEAVAKRHAEKRVLEGVTLGIAEGDRVGVVGVNGSGKSTLLQLVAGSQEPDSGRVVRRSGLRLAVLEQDPGLDPDLGALATLQRTRPGVAEHEAAAILQRMGITDQEQALGTLSGGQRRRVALARALVGDVDLLVLDEPTNHLDVDVVEWLEQTLLSRGGALLLVTHDRYLLDRVATRVIEVHDGTTSTHQGTYASYLEARSLREQQAQSSERRRQNRMRTELAWLRRGPQARAGKAKYRVEAARALMGAEPDQAARPLALDFPSRRIGSKVSDVHRAGVAFGDRTVLRDVEVKLGKGARLGVVGPNGSGKTTLLRLLTGRVVPSTGSVDLGDTIAVGWYGQDPEPLPPGLRVLDAVDQVARETLLRSGLRIGAGLLLETFGFPSQAQRALVGELSGGERRRLELLRVLADAPNLLALDEPTNDLDLDTLGVLEDYLDSWPGALLVASHDRYFLDRVCDDLMSVEPDGTVRHHPGGWSAWRERLAAQRGAQKSGEREGAVPSSRTAGSAAAVKTRKLSFNERRELHALEERIPQLEGERARLSGALHAAGADHVAAQTASTALAEVLAELDTAEHRWLELADTAEV